MDNSEKLIKENWVDFKDRFCIYFVEDSTGCFDICFCFSNIDIQMFYSTCTNGINDLFLWLKQIDNRNKVIDFRIDEECAENNIRLTNIYGADIYELTIENYSTDIFKKIISIDTFFKRLIYGLNNFFSKEEWSDDYYGKLILENIQPYIEKYKINEFKCNKCNRGKLILCKQK